MYCKYIDFQMNEMFVDTKNMAIVKKMVKPRDTQGEFESRRLETLFLWMTNLLYHFFLTTTQL